MGKINRRVGKMFRETCWVGGTWENKNLKVRKPRKTILPCVKGGGEKGEKGRKKGKGQIHNACAVNLSWGHVRHEGDTRTLGVST